MKKVVKSILLVLLIGCSIAGNICLFSFYVHKANRPTLTFIGHASVKLKTTSGKVIYIDPYYPVGDYREPADYILITHGHSDHYNISLCTKADDCKTILWSAALKDGQYQVYDFDDVRIEAVPSGGNSNHSIQNCVGYIVTIDGVSIYHAGDTSMSEGKYEIAKKKIDYAMYPVDGVYDMDAEEATQVADLIQATHNIPIHGHNQEFYKQFQEFHAKGKILLMPGETISLESSSSK